METPTWLDPTKSEPAISHYKAVQLVNDTIFESIFESTIDRVALGHSLSTIVSDDPRNLDLARYLRWIQKDKDRRREFNEAKRIGTHLVLEQMIRISDGEDNPMEDVARSTLRVNTRRLYLKAYNPDTFGDSPSNAASATGGGGITINIGSVESPYAPTITANDNVIDVTPNTPNE